MKTIITGEIDGQPIMRRQTAEEQLLEALRENERARSVKTKTLEDTFWKSEAKHSEDFAGLENYLEDNIK